MLDALVWVAKALSQVTASAAAQVDDGPYQATEHCRRAAIVVETKSVVKRLVELLHRDAGSTNETVAAAAVPGMKITRTHPAFAPLTAVWVLTNLAACEPGITVVLMRAAGGAEALALPLLHLLQSPEPELREQAAWAAGNVAAACVRTRDALLDAGNETMVEHLLEHLLSISPAAVPLSDAVVEVDGGWRAHWGRRVAGVIANFCGGPEPRPPYRLLSNCLPCLVRLLDEEDGRLSVPVMRGIANIAGAPIHHQQLAGPERAAAREDALARVNDICFSDGLLRRVISLLRRCCDGKSGEAAASVDDQASGLVEHGLTLLQHVASAGCHSPAPNDVYVQLLVDEGALPVVLKLLYSDKMQARWRAVSVISNILAGPPSSIDAVMDVDAATSRCILGEYIPLLLRLLVQPTFPKKDDEDIYRFRRPTAADDEQAVHQKESEWLVRQEVAWAICNVCEGGNTTQIGEMLHQGSVGVLAGALVDAVEDSCQFVDELPDGSVNEAARQRQAELLQAGDPAARTSFALLPPVLAGLTQLLAFEAEHGSPPSSPRGAGGSPTRAAS
eukprot:SAG22_NODE_3067_length_1968_cov_1.936865_1_plen_559_part_01